MDVSVSQKTGRSGETFINTLHLKGLNPLWMWVWVKDVHTVESSLHTSHMKNISPMWMHEQAMTSINLMVTPCINNILLMNTTLKNGELLKHFKISKTAPTCFSL